MSAPVSRDSTGRSDPGSHLDVWRAVRSGLGFEGEAFAPDLPRLADALRSGGGEADWPARYRLRFGRDDDGRAVVLGGAELTVRPVCQRCLDPVAIQLDVPIALALVPDRAPDRVQALALPDHLDPVETEDGQVRPLDLVEDELLLSLPQVPMHPQGGCAMLSQPSAEPDGNPATDQGEAAPDNPFAVLASLKRPRSEH